MRESVDLMDAAAADGLIVRPAAGAKVHHRYRMECLRPGVGQAWVEEYNNLVVTQGLNYYLASVLGTGNAGAGTLWYVGLIGGPEGGTTFAAADVMSSHAGWAEGTLYAAGTRSQWISGAVSGGSVDNSAAKASFAINATGTVQGSFLSSGTAKAGTVGNLLGEGTFAAGSRTVQNGDTLNVTLTASLTSS